MSYEKFFKELQNLPDIRKDLYAHITGHGLPIVIYGAGNMAEHVTKELSAFNIPIFGYAVDDEYYCPNQTCLGRPLYRFSELAAQPDKYVFILAVNYDRSIAARKSDFLNNKKIICYEILAIPYEHILLEQILDKRDELSETLDLFEDDLSRETLMAYLKMRVSWDLSYLKPIFREGLYFNELTAPAMKGVFVDCGAYDGDTIEKFVNWSSGNYSKIFGIEADKPNFEKLENFIKEKNYKNVQLFNCGVWNEKTQLSFKSIVDSNADSHVTDSGTETINADTLDNIFAAEDVGFIKLVIPGSEFQAIQGARFLMKEKAPVFAISVYYNFNSLIDIPKFIKSVNNNYRLYLRKHSRITLQEFILYAIPH